MRGCGGLLQLSATGSLALALARERADAERQGDCGPSGEERVARCVRGRPRDEVEPAFSSNSALDARTHLSPLPLLCPNRDFCAVEKRCFRSSVTRSVTVTPTRAIMKLFLCRGPV